MAEATSTKPYLLRALYEWCVDNGFTPYIAVHVDDSVQVPMEYVKNGEIVLNISPYSSANDFQDALDFINSKVDSAGQKIGYQTINLVGDGLRDAFDPNARVRAS